MIIKSKLIACVAAAAVTFLASTQASATILAAVTHLGNSYIAGNAYQTVRNMRTPLFSHKLGERFIVTFSAECAVDAPDGNHNGRSEVNIVVINNSTNVATTLAPTTDLESTNAFCSGNGIKGYDAWANHSLTAVAGTNLATGVYRVEVRARLLGGATGGWFGERSLVVFK